MASFTDSLGLEYTASDASSVDTFNEAITAYLASSKAVMPVLESVIETDNEMVMAQCLRAYMLKLAADPRFEAPFHGIVSALPGKPANDRERQHIAALDAWARNDLAETVQRLEHILVDHPRDMVALRIAHYLHFYAGTPEAMRDSVARSVERWQPSLPYYGYLLGMHAFGLEESGEYAAAEAAGRRAVELNPGDIWAAHAVQHVFQMNARYRDGIEWMTSLMPGFGDANNFVYHMHWHQALCHIGEGEYDAVLSIYDSHLVPALDDDFYLDVCNAASLLWRLEMLGVDVGDRWERVNALSAARVTDRELLFSTLHYLMTPARLHDSATIAKAIDSIHAWADENSTQGSLCRTVGLPLAEAIVDLGAGDRVAAASKLADVREQIQLIGGSHAQRDLFNQFLTYSEQAAS